MKSALEGEGAEGGLRPLSHLVASALLSVDRADGAGRARTFSIRGVEWHQVDAAALLDLVEALLLLLLPLPGGDVGEELGQMRDEVLHFIHPDTVSEDENFPAVTGFGAEDGGSVSAEADTFLVLRIERLSDGLVGRPTAEGDSSIEYESQGGKSWGGGSFWAILQRSALRLKRTAKSPAMRVRAFFFWCAMAS
jgi:hypothetical protein